MPHRSTQGETIHVNSWNVCGLNKAVKMGKVLTHLQQLKGDISFLQETHLKTNYVLQLKGDWLSHTFHFNHQARGAAITSAIKKLHWDFQDGG